MLIQINTARTATYKLTRDDVLRALGLTDEERNKELRLVKLVAEDGDVAASKYVLAVVVAETTAGNSIEK